MMITQTVMSPKFSNLRSKPAGTKQIPCSEWRNPFTHVKCSEPLNYDVDRIVGIWPLGILNKRLIKININRSARKCVIESIRPSTMHRNVRATLTNGAMCTV